ncbi:MAG: hypothetical protein IJ420_00535 [Lachnospiraceae bacterium]|nr:hypothetical protein [Lachnospiraceae bacterium]MBQ8632075.1 hypothetical protein [Lachnospiraceae bacterium]
MKKINRAVCGTVAVLGVLIAVAGLILCMCETPDFADQLRNMLVGLALIAGGSLMAYVGGAGRWQEGPYAEL